MVEAVHPKNVASKITGMLLEQENTTIIQFIKNPDYLAEKNSRKYPSSSRSLYNKRNRKTY